MSLQQNHSKCSPLLCQILALYLSWGIFFSLQFVFICSDDILKSGIAKLDRVFKYFVILLAGHAVSRYQLQPILADSVQYFTNNSYQKNHRNRLHGAHINKLNNFSKRFTRRTAMLTCDCSAKILCSLILLKSGLGPWHWPRLGSCSQVHASLKFVQPWWFIWDLIRIWKFHDLI